MNNIIFSSLPSTNDYIKDNYKSLKDRDVIIALSQTKGRGRFDRVWESKDDLTFSILFVDSKKYHHMIAPIAVVYALCEFNIDATIKWPNDIYVEGRKLGGILIEVINDKYTIVGIGINLSEKTNYVSSFVKVDRNMLLEKIEEKYEAVLKYNSNELLTSYKKLSYTLNKNVNYNGKIYRIADYTLSGEIIIQSDDEKLCINANEIDIKSCLVR